jgi:hypothetical protein
MNTTDSTDTPAKAGKRGRRRNHSSIPVFIFYLVKMEMEFGGVGLNLACERLRADFETLGVKAPWKTIRRLYLSGREMLEGLPDGAASVERSMTELVNRRSLCGYNGLLDGMRLLGLTPTDLAKGINEPLGL